MEPFILVGAIGNAKNIWKHNKSNKAKAISAELLELNLKVHLYKPVIVGLIYSYQGQIIVNLKEEIFLKYRKA